MIEAIKVGLKLWCVLSIWVNTAISVICWWGSLKCREGTFGCSGWSDDWQAAAQKTAQTLVWGSSASTSSQLLTISTLLSLPFPPSPQSLPSLHSQHWNTHSHSPTLLLPHLSSLPTQFHASPNSCSGTPAPHRTSLYNQIANEL